MSGDTGVTDAGSDKTECGGTGGVTRTGSELDHGWPRAHNKIQSHG